MAKGSENPFPLIRFIGQASAPATPPTDEAYVYYSTVDDELYIIRDDGISTLIGGGGAAVSDEPSGMKVTQRTVPIATGVSVTAGYWLSANVADTAKVVKQVVAANVNLSASPVTNPKIDVICFDENTGGFVRVDGTQAASPVIPDISNSRHPLALVYRRVGETAVLDEDNSTDGYIVDVRGLPQVLGLVQNGLELLLLASTIRNSGNTAILQMIANGGLVVTGTMFLQAGTGSNKVDIQAGAGMVVPRLAADPAVAPEGGLFYFNTTTSKFRGNDGTAWVDLH